MQQTAMIGWIRRLVQAVEVTPGTALPVDRMLELRSSLNELETLFRAGERGCNFRTTMPLASSPH